MRVGVVDIGSYSIKMMIAEEVDGKVVILESLKNIVSIGLPTYLRGNISQEAIRKTVQVLENYKLKLEEYRVDQFRVIATTAVREASNRDIFIDAISRRTGLNIEVMNVGDVVYYIDAYISFKLRNSYDIEEKNILIAELGAGSMDVSIMQKGFTLTNLGLSVGMLHFKQLFKDLKGTFEETSEAIQEFIDNEFHYLKSTLPSIHIDDIMLIDENTAYLERLLPEVKLTEAFYSLTHERAKILVKELSGKNGMEISREYDIPEDIANTIFPYALVLEKFFMLADVKEIRLLEISLAEAISASMLFSLETAKRYNRTEQLTAVAKSMCDHYHVDIKHAEFVAEMAQKIFQAVAGNIGLQASDEIYLILAAYLRDVGMYVHNRSHHKHSEYVIMSQNLFRLTDEEIRMIACIARYHRKSSPKPSHLVYSQLSKDKQLVVQKLSGILRIANALDRAHKQKVKKLDIELNGDDVKIIVKTTHNFLLEEADFKAKQSLFERVIGGQVKLVVTK